MRHLAMVLWDPDQPTTRAQTTLHLSDDGARPTPEMLLKEKGRAITEFFQRQSNLEIGIFVEAFPGHIVPRRDNSGELTWESGFKWMTLPSDPDRVQRLATLLQMQISVWCHYREHDTTPRMLFEVEPNEDW